jgi:transposase
MDALTSKPVRRRHSAEFKRQVVDACRQPDVSVAGVALAHGVNANLVRRWLKAQGVLPPSRLLTPDPVPRPEADALEFVPLRIDPAALPSQDIRLELRRGTATVTVHWPLSAAGDCGAWLQAWLR